MKDIPLSDADLSEPGTNYGYDIDAIAKTAENTGIGRAKINEVRLDS